jgi:hypothetical protein
VFRSIFSPGSKPSVTVATTFSTCQSAMISPRFGAGSPEDDLAVRFFATISHLLGFI